VGVVQVDGPHGEHPERAVRIAGERQQLPDRKAELEQTQRRRTRPRRRRRNGEPRRRRCGRPDPSRSTAWINDAGTPGAGELVEGERRDVRAGAVAARNRHGCRQVCVACRHLAAQDPGIRRGVRPLPCNSRIAGSSACASSYRRASPRARAAGAVATDKRTVSTDTSRSRGCSPVPHESPLYECALTPSPSGSRDLGG
jgi:hypothetical protein